MKNTNFLDFGIKIGQRNKLGLYENLKSRTYFNK